MPPDSASQKPLHPILIEPEYGLERALADPDAYIRHLCSSICLKRPWIKPDEVYQHLKCTCVRHRSSPRSGAGCMQNSQGVPSHQVIKDFPMSHRTFRGFHHLLGWLQRGGFRAHAHWREAVRREGELPFPPECFTPAFFAARAALGHGSTRHTLAGGPKGRKWADEMRAAGLDYLNHDPAGPRGAVPPFWAGFLEHQAARWDGGIKRAVDDALRDFARRQRESKRKREGERGNGGEAEEGRPNKYATLEDRNRALGAAMKSLLGPPPDGRGGGEQPAAHDNIDFQQDDIKEESSSSSSSEPVSLDRVQEASVVLQTAVFNPSAFMCAAVRDDQPASQKAPKSQPAKIDLRAARAARQASSRPRATQSQQAMRKSPRLLQSGYGTDSGNRDKTPPSEKLATAVPMTPRSKLKIKIKTKSAHTPGKGSGEDGADDSDDGSTTVGFGLTPNRQLL